MTRLPAAPAQRNAKSGNAAQATLRALALGLSCLLLTFAGGLSPDLSPWAAWAWPAGAALAGMARWGRMVLPAALVGSGLALWGLSGAAAAFYASCAIGAGCLLGDIALRRVGFDTRLERAHDVGLLFSVVTFAAALPTALLLSAWLSAVSPALPLPTLTTGWVMTLLGMLLTAAPVLALDRRTLHAFQPSTPWHEPVLATLAILVALCGLWLAPGSRSPLAPWAPMVPLLVVLALALRGQFALAACAMLLSAMTIGAAPRMPLGAWGSEAGPAWAFVAWLGSGLAMLLGGHAANASLRARSERWEWALDGSRLGVADWRLDDDRGFASSAWRALVGHTRRQWQPEDWLEQTHADDRPGLQQAIAALTAGEAGRLQIELRQPDGTDWRWMEATLLVMERDTQGQPTRLLATLADVHERRDAQERKRMSAALFQHLHEGLLVTDADLHALDVNPAYCQILGVTRDELIGTVPSLLRPTPADPIARQQRAAMWASLRDTGSWRGELFERRRNGEICTLQATVSTVPGPARDLRYHVLVISDITEQHVQREQLERQAHFDELTRLPNRARLSQLLDEAMGAADRDGYLLAVYYLDLDRFKPVNDRWGHAAGDRLLAELAGRLRSALRSREHWADSAARLGGDEFVLLLRAGTLEEARLAVERVLRVVSLPYVVDPAEEPVQVTASMGATVYPIDRSDADTLLRHADHAMYGAKQAGRNGYLFFDPEHRRRTEERVMAIGRVQEALDQSEFVLHYQPKVDMRSGRVHGFEALLRWDHPQQGLVAPLQFLPLIENTGLSSRVGDWVLSQALEHLSQWRRSGLDISVSVNISARHLQEPDFALRLSELLARHADPLARHLELEMLETAAHADVDATSALLARCQAIGVRFALDDFGTGYSTLTYLKRLPVDVLKIDRSFVHHMLDDTQDRAIVEGVIGLARTFGCVVVAEGVESPAQARTLLELGCEIGQGTGIAAPMPSDQVAAWVRDYRGMFALAPAELPIASLPSTPARNR